MTTESEQLARHVERHWGEESRKALARDEERLRALVDGAMAASRARTGPSTVLPAWSKGVFLCAAAFLVSEVHDRRASAVAHAPPLASLATPETAPPPPPEATVRLEPATIAVADLPAAEPAPIPRPSAVARPSFARAVPSVARAAALSPAELFARANEERRQGELRAAEVDYRRLMNEAPSSREALLSHVILGHVIEQRDPPGALALFERYLEREGMGVLAEEARTSRARLLSRLGKRREASSAWRELLERHPETLFRSEAEAGLRAATPDE